MKKGARYLRFSNDKQSTNSIERQDIETAHWMKYTDVHIVDTFIDEGYSAKNFDRPDVKKLFDFIRKNKNVIDYLVVSELSRFSRESGEAISLVKKIQTVYGVKIVSARRSTIYDCTDSNSFLLMGLEFLMAHSENIKRESDINGGIYSAKMKGRYVHGRAPFGYLKEGVGEHSRLVIDPERSFVIRYIYTSYLQNVPVYIIEKEARKLGLTNRKHGIIQSILSNPIYSGQQYVKAWKEHPGGLFPALHEAIIDPAEWDVVQKKLKEKPRPGISVSDEMPLRTVLRCHCSQPVTGAPSRNRWGNYYYYYKCKHSGHLNLSVKKAHQQLEEAFQYMSLTDRLVQAIQITSERTFGDRIKENRKTLARKKNEIGEIAEKLESMEEKYISNRIEYETYQKWFSELTSRRTIVSAQIEQLQRSESELRLMLDENLEQFTDLPYVYKNLETVAKQEFIRRVFDSRLYYRDGIYRTPYIIPAFTHNSLILKQKKLLILEEERGLSEKVPSGGLEGAVIEPLSQLLSFLHSVRVA